MISVVGPASVATWATGFELPFIVVQLCSEVSFCVFCRGCLCKFKIRGNSESGPQCFVNGTLVRIYPVNAFHGFSYPPGSIEQKMDVDSANHQNSLIGFDFSSNFGTQPAVACIYFARFQRAPEGSDHSTTQ